MNENQQQNTKLVFLHGWGQSEQAWFQQTDYFAEQSLTINLPGHGAHSDVPANQWVEYMVNELEAIEAGKIILVGWSLGGQLAIAAEGVLRDKKRILGLVLVSTTPCFRQKPDWDFGCSVDVWNAFQSSAETQEPKLMQRFFQTMLHGDTLTRSKRNHLAKNAVDRRNPPSRAGLNAGLQLLSDWDLRPDIQHISIPTLILHGEQDVIVPVDAGHFLATNISSSTSHVFQDCGHAPFLTHHAAFNDLLEQWWKNISM